jgi:hypothetical protein
MKLRSFQKFSINYSVLLRKEPSIHETPRIFLLLHTLFPFLIFSDRIS